VAGKKAMEPSTADLVIQQKISNRLLAAQLRSTMKQKDLIMLLAGTGASHSDIAEIVGTTAGTVQNALARTKKSGGESQRSKTSAKEDNE